ncbi:MAG: hypothetical protein R3F60_29550 [bacterium]
MAQRIIVIALALPGCILESQFCGEGFVEADGRCVPASAAPAWYGDGGIDAAEPTGRVDGSAVDAGPPDVAVVDATPRDASPPEPDRWSDRTSLLIVDRGSRQAARSTPTTPGFDLDAVAFFSPDGEVIGELSTVHEAQINDPFARSFATQPRAALGAADSRGLDDAEHFVSLGTEGGYLFAGLTLARPLRIGDRLVVFEEGGDRADELAEVFLCLDDVLSLNRCVSVADVVGTTELVLPP